MKRKLDAQVEALKQKSKKKKNIFHEGEPGDSSLMQYIVEASIQSKFKILIKALWQVL